jgi:hypothetical protein
VYVITTDRGLQPASLKVMANDLVVMGTVDIHKDNPAYRRPLLADARRIAEAIGPAGQAVILGSIATGKYVEVLLEALGAYLS